MGNKANYVEVTKYCKPISFTTRKMKFQKRNKIQKNEIVFIFYVF